MTEAERRSALEAIASEVTGCTRCRLSETRTRAVPGEGHPSTEVLFVGEGPGLNEDRQGRPFVGAAGQFLEELLGSVGWTREEVFITNVVKCRPPQNRDPEPDEIAACAPYLQRQLEALDPALVVTLGRHSMGRFMPGARIGQVHGTFRPVPDGMGASDALVFAMYHPAAALHQGSLRQTLLDDMTQVPAALVEARRRRSAAAGEGTADQPVAAPAVDEPVAAPAVDDATAADDGAAANDAADPVDGPAVDAAGTDEPEVARAAGSAIDRPEVPQEAEAPVVPPDIDLAPEPAEATAPAAPAPAPAPAPLTEPVSEALPSLAEAPATKALPPDEAPAVVAPAAAAMSAVVAPAAAAPARVAPAAPGPVPAPVAPAPAPAPPTPEAPAPFGAVPAEDRVPEDQMTLFQS